MGEDHSQLSDEVLATRVQSGDAGLYGVLMRRYLPKMQRYVAKFLFGYDDVEDVVQEVFVKAYTHLQQFDATRSFSSWLYRIAHNECINTIKKRKREPLPFFDPDAIFPHPVAKETPRDHAERAEVLTLIERALRALDPKYREPIVLYYIEERSYKEIADIMRIPIATVGVRLRRAREQLQARARDV